MMKRVPADRKTRTSRWLASLTTMIRCGAVSACFFIPEAVSRTLPAAPVARLAAQMGRGLRDVYRCSSSEAPWVVPTAVIKIRPRQYASIARKSPAR